MPDKKIKREMYRSSFMLISKTFILSMNLDLKLRLRSFGGYSGVSVVDRPWNKEPDCTSRFCPVCTV